METTASIAIEVVKTLIEDSSSYDGQKHGFRWNETPEENLVKLLNRALSEVAKDSEFWEEDTGRQVDEIITTIFILLNDFNDSKVLDDPCCFESSHMSSVFDLNTLKRIYKCLKEDKDSYDYLSFLVSNHNQRDNPKTVNETNLVKKRHAEKQENRNDEESCCFLTSSPMKVDLTHVIGRQKDIQIVWAALENKKHVLLTGYSGIGKTKLAQLLFYEYQSQFDEVAWIDYYGNLKNSFLTSINVLWFSENNYQNDNERWMAMKSILPNDGKKKLFVVDHVDYDTNHDPKLDKELLELTGWNDTTILLTSRMEQLDNYESIVLDALDIDDCVKVFNRNYSGYSPKQETIINIIELLNRHTMTIELLAKGAKQENLDKIYNKLLKSGSIIVNRRITTDQHKEIVTIEHQLKDLFDLQKRSKKDKKILRCIAVLPVNGVYTIKEIEQWLGLKKADLYDVIKDGWLSYDEGKESYFLHPLVREIVRLNKTISYRRTANKLFNYFVKHDELFNNDNGFVLLQQIIYTAESVLDSVPHKKNKRFIALYKNIGCGYENIGDYDMGLKYYKNVLKINECKFGRDNIDTALTYNKIAELYVEKCDYVNALEYYEKTLCVLKNKLNKKHRNIAATCGNISKALYYMGDYNKALEYGKKVMEKSGFKYMDPYVATTFYNLGMICYAKGEYDNALRYYKNAIVIFESQLGKNHPEIVSIYNNMSVVYRDMGNYDMALECNKTIIAIEESVSGKEHPDTATAYNSIAEVYEEMCDFDKALEFYEKVLKIIEPKEGDFNPYNIAETYHNIAGVYRNKGDYNKALVFYEKALKILESNLGEEHIDTLTTYNGMGLVYRDMGNYDRAMEIFNKNLAICKSKMGEANSYVAATYSNIAGIYGKSGDYDKALEFYEKALKIGESELGKDHPDTASIYNDIALIYHAKGDYDKALEYDKKAMAIREFKLGEDHPGTAATYNNIAEVYEGRGDYKKALENYKKSLRIAESKLGEDHPHTAIIYNNLAGVYKDMGDYGKSLEYYEKALKIEEFKLGENHPDIATTYNNIALLYGDIGKYNLALAYFLKSLKIWLNKDSCHPNAKLYFRNLFSCFNNSNNKTPFVDWMIEQLNNKEREACLALLRSMEDDE